MADAMDLVQQRVEEERQRHIRVARAKTPGVSRVLCVECEAPIPPARRRAITVVYVAITRAGISTFPTVIIKIRISLKKKFAHLQKKPSGQRLSAPALMKRWRC